MPTDFLLNNYSTDKNILFTMCEYKNSLEEKINSDNINYIKKHHLSNKKSAQPNNLTLTNESHSVSPE